MWNFIHIIYLKPCIYITIISHQSVCVYMRESHSYWRAIMKDQSTCVCTIKGLKISIGGTPASKAGEVTVLAKEPREIAIGELNFESKLDYCFENDEIKETNNAIIEVFEQMGKLSVQLVNLIMADKREGREHQLQQMRLADELDNLKNQRIHERARYGDKTSI